MVETYFAEFYDEKKHGYIRQEIELQALSAQNMADILRAMYGNDICIYAIYKIARDWE